MNKVVGKFGYALHQFSAVVPASTKAQGKISGHDHGDHLDLEQQKK